MSMEAVRKAVDETPVLRMEPEPLRREVFPPEQFPIDELGDVIAPATRHLRETIQAPAAICSHSLLSAATLAIQGHANVVIDGRTHPLSEYFLTVGESGERKSSVDEWALWPVRKHQKALVEQYDANLAEYRTENDVWKKAREEVLNSRKKGTQAKRSVLNEIGEPPTAPLLPFLLCEEPTYEGLVKLMIAGQPSIGLFSDEGGRMIGGYGMNKDNQLKTSAGLSNLWDGREISRVRSGDGSTVLYGRRVSVHLMVQPAVSQLLLSNALLVDQGLLSRCLTTWPTSTAGSRLYKEVDLYGDREIKGYESRLLSILETRLPIAEGKLNELQPRGLPLAPDAKRIWIAFHDHTEKQLADDKALAPIRGFANKAPEHAVRLAGVLALVDNLDSQAIGVEYVRSGINLVQHYLAEALRLFDTGISNPDLVLAEKLLAWAQHQETEFVYLRKIYQCGPNAIRDAVAAKRIVSILEEHGWFMRIDEGMKLDGSYRKEVWRVHK